METRAKRRRGQTALEYTLIIGGAILFVVIIALLLRSGIIGNTTTKLKTDNEKLRNCFLETNLHYSNFDSGPNPGWIPISGNSWLFQNNKYLQNSFDLNPTVKASLYLDKVYSNFTMLFKGRVTSAGGGYMGAIIRSDAAGGSKYVVRIKTNTVDLVKYVGAATFLLKTAAITWDVKNEALVKIRAYGNSYKVYMNGEVLPIITHDDTGTAAGPGPLVPYYPSGFIGVGTFSGFTKAEFDDICLFRE